MTISKVSKPQKKMKGGYNDALAALLPVPFGDLPPAIPARPLARPVCRVYRNGLVDVPRADVPGWIYFIHASTGYVKIGLTFKGIERRIKGMLVDVPPPITVTVLHCIRAHDVYKAERVAHQRYASTRARGEWFALDPVDIEGVLLLRDYEFDLMSANAHQP